MERSVFGSCIFSKMIKTQKVEIARQFVNTIEIQQDLVLQESCTFHQEMRHECRQSAVKFQSLHSITILTSFVAVFKKDKTTVHSMRRKTHQLEYNKIIGEKKKHKIWREKTTQV